MTDDATSRVPQDEPDPGAVDGFAALMRKALSGDDLSVLGAALWAREPQPDGPAALMDLSTLLHMHGAHEVALSVQRLALTGQQLFRLRTQSTARSVRVLVVMVPGDLGSNTPIEFLIEDSDISVHFLYVVAWLPIPTCLPEHDVVFVGVCAAEPHRAVLAQITTWLSQSQRPVINRPDRIMGLARDSVCGLLAGAPGLVMPMTAKLTRERVAAIARGACSISALLTEADYPILIRPVDFHGGQGLRKIDGACALESYLAGQPEPEFFVTRYVDYRSPDGLFRKTRVVLVDSKPFASHLAISDAWMIHYKNAGMSASSEKRAEEARFMENFEQGFARKHAAALHTVSERTHLDYLVLDCAETRAGELLVFEVDNSALVHAFDPIDMFEYKQAPMRKVVAAFGNLLRCRASRGIGA